MKNDMQRRKSGGLLFLGLALLLSDCRSSNPPPIDPICIMDGHGGGDCVDPAGKQKYMAPSEMKNYWATSQDSMAAFSAWCYDVPRPVALQRMQELEIKARGEAPPTN